MLKRLITAACMVVFLGGSVFAGFGERKAAIFKAFVARDQAAFQKAMEEAAADPSFTKEELVRWIEKALAKKGLTYTSTSTRTPTPKPDPADLRADLLAEFKKAVEDRGTHADTGRTAKDIYNELATEIKSGDFVSLPDNKDAVKTVVVPLIADLDIVSGLILGSGNLDLAAILLDALEYGEVEVTKRKEFVDKVLEDAAAAYRTTDPAARGDSVIQKTGGTELGKLVVVATVGTTSVEEMHSNEWMNQDELVVAIIAAAKAGELTKLMDELVAKAMGRSIDYNPEKMKDGLKAGQADIVAGLASDLDVAATYIELFYQGSVEADPSDLKALATAVLAAVSTEYSLATNKADTALGKADPEHFDALYNKASEFKVDENYLRSFLLDGCSYAVIGTDTVNFAKRVEEVKKLGGNLEEELYNAYLNNPDKYKEMFEGLTEENAVDRVKIFLVWLDYMDENSASDDEVGMKACFTAFIVGFKAAGKDVIQAIEGDKTAGSETEDYKALADRSVAFGLDDQFDADIAPLAVAFNDGRGLSWYEKLFGSKSKKVALGRHRR